MPLERDGHHVETADGGRDGVAAFLKAAKDGAAFDVVITDLGMPYVDGSQVARLVKAAVPGTPVILLTGWGMKAGREERIPGYVDVAIGKPPKLRQVRAALRKVVGERS